MKPHILIPEAVAEIAHAFEWYESRSPGLGERFVNAATETVERICENPLAFPHASRTARGARVFGFPYSIYFAEQDDIVVVYAVFHERRSPRARRGRRAR